MKLNEKEFLTGEKYSKIDRCNRLLDFMKEAYAQDEQILQFPPERCGWRSRVQIAQALHLPMKTFYGKNAKEIVSDLQDLISSHKLELKYFDGERGRGGEIMRFRLLHDSAGKSTEKKEIIVQKVNLLSTGIQDLDRILGGGYAERSAIMINGPMGIGKEALGYFFLENGIEHGDFCLYVTHHSVVDLLESMKEFRARTDRVPNFVASSGSPKVCDLKDPSSIASEILSLIEQKNENQKRVRLVTDILSPLLVLNSTELVYNYWDELLTKIKMQNGIVIALTNEEMPTPGAVDSIRNLFDSEIEFRIYEQGLSITPLLRIKKLYGMSALNVYFSFGFSEAKRMEITPHVSS